MNLTANLWGIICSTTAFLLHLPIEAAELKLIGRHPTSPLITFPQINVLKAFDGRIYMGYGNWNIFPAVTLVSYDPSRHEFRIEFSPATDSIDLFRVLGGVLYAPSGDPAFYDENRDYSYLSPAGWRDASPAGLIHVIDMGSTDGTVLWAVGTKPVDETAPNGPAVFRSTDGGRNWNNLSIRSSLPERRYYWGFPLRGRFYVRDTYYDGTNGTRVAPSPYVGLSKSTPVGQGTNEFVVGGNATVEGQDGRGLELHFPW